MHSRSQTFVLTWYVYILVAVLGCFSPFKITEVENPPISATFSIYQSAFGKGRGIIFSVHLPENFSKQYIIDSFYLSGKPIPFTIRNMGNESLLEANYYVAQVSETVNGKMNDSKNNSNDSILTDGKFYPSYILLSQDSRKLKWNITRYQEIVSDKKY